MCKQRRQSCQVRQMKAQLDKCFFNGEYLKRNIVLQLFIIQNLTHFHQLLIIVSGFKLGLISRPLFMVIFFKPHIQTRK